MMQAQQQMVREFLIKHLGVQDNGRPNKTSLFNKWLLIKEEFEEVTAALGLEVPSIEATEQSIQALTRYEKANGKHTPVNEVALIDGICDLLYVIFNLCEELEIDIEPFFAEVHRSNMTKTPGRLSPTQKILKGPEWTPPCIAEMLASYRDRTG